MKKTFIIFIWLLFIGLVFPQENKNVKVGLHWLPQSQFAGYYVGIKKGIYEKYGLDVELYHSFPGHTAQEMLLEKNVHFASMFLSTALILKSYDYPLVNVCQLSQKSALMFVTKKSRNINKVSELNGKKIGIWRSGFDEIPKAFFNKNNLTVELVLINSSVNLFLLDGIDAMTTMWYNEYHRIINSGYNEDELNTFFFSDYGLNIPEDGLYCLKENYDKETTKKFISATLEAWQYAFNNIDETISFVQKEMEDKNIAFNKAHQLWMLNRMNDLFNVKDKNYRPGELLENDFNTALKEFQKINQIKKNFSYNDFYFGVK